MQLAPITSTKMALEPLMMIFANNPLQLRLLGSLEQRIGAQWKVL